MLEECTSGCLIFEDKVCSECSRYQECIDRGMNFVLWRMSRRRGIQSVLDALFWWGVSLKQSRY